MIQLADFEYPLPPHLIAQEPIQPRDHCKLLLVDRKNGVLSHYHFYDLIELLTPNDVLVLNQSKVLPARLYGSKPTGGKVEVLLLAQLGPDTWEAISKPGLKSGQEIRFEDLRAQVIHRNPSSSTIDLKFDQSGPSLLETLYQLGKTPIPPYIKTQLTEAVLRREYQTVYAKELGSSAAPTAGLHFTKELLAGLKQKGVTVEYVTLHVGQGTFQNLRPENLASKQLHQEWYELTPDTAQRLNQAKMAGKRIIAVGTTSARTLESAWNHSLNLLEAKTDTTQLFIYPPYPFKIVDSLITNFHLPQSSLLMLVASLVSQPQTAALFTTFNQSLIGKAYQQAIESHYRFYSFGDAMWIT